ncbi:uncharacterized protein KQ657_004899 [Scheffersomyces spartinae]|uniref:Sec39 domain-containing protein n=1 Tax=Scheffersomyces spartinae TaxID=45513 RepID=A0A9P8AIU9_9ASCO|nr:uncharacterized protein KQ657_004899 [Scheffersomyces spartinae]KAG7194189.1 hypothetical protein KQ657_004899 [Scheffersomyces spartinae]
MDSIQIADCKVILAVAQRVAEEVNVGELMRFIERISGHLNYEKTTFPNVLVLLTVLLSPIKVTMSQLAMIIETLLERDNKDNIQEFLELADWAFKESWGDDIDLLEKTASDMLVSYSLQIKELYGIEMVGTVSVHQILFQFIKAKVDEYGRYGNDDVSECEPLFHHLAGYGPFQEWYSGLIKPFEYYWTSYGRYQEEDNEVLTLDKAIRHERDFHYLFNALVEPLKNQPKMTSDWMKKIIIPLVSHYSTQDARRTFIEWIFKDNTANVKPISKLTSMNTIITQLNNNNNSLVDVDDFNEILKLYLASIFFDIMQYGDSMSSMDIVNLYDFITEALAGFITSQSDIIEPSFEPFQDASSFDIFVKLNSRNPLLQPTLVNLRVVQRMFLICSKLYPINKLTIQKYLLYKTDREEEGDKDKTKALQALTIMNTLDSNNAENLLEAFNLFVETFVSSRSAKQDLCKLVVERFLYENLFDFLEKDITAASYFQLDTDDYYELVNDKFWYSFNSAVNLNEKKGKLYEANECLLLFDRLSNRSDLSAANKNQIMKVKHLMKAVALMKNFKIMVSMNVPITPSLVVSNFGGGTGDFSHNTPVDLVSLILEYNPKSYLAFEKLYKIVNYLVIFFATTTDEGSATYYFNKVKSACIESALIDDNFNYAYKQCLILFSHYQKDQQNLNDIWLTFYQVGKYISPRWFEDDVDQHSTTVEMEKLSVWKKQREVLSKALKFMQPSESSMDNSRVILSQWRRVNDQIEESYANYLYLDQITAMEVNQRNLSKQLNTIANEFIGEASNSTSQAGEKISNLLVSGLGWAIGANRSK